MRKGPVPSMILMLVAALGVAVTTALGSGRRAAVRNGGTFRVAAARVDSIDPALGQGSAYLDASCALLLRPRGKLEVAQRPPSVSRDGKTYTFHLRRTFRFYTGTRVTAASFAHEFDRSLNPALGSPGAEFLSEVVGAEDVVAGKTQHARGIRARGFTLTIRLTQPTPDFPARLTQPYACAVPTTLAATPEAVQAPFSGAGPYYIAEYVPGQRLVLRRNSYYRGPRRPRVRQIVVSFFSDNVGAMQAVADGQADWADIGRGLGGGPGSLTPAQRARVRVLTFPGLLMQYTAMNTSRPLFRNNAPLRQAVNFAIDRTAITRIIRKVAFARPVAQYLPPSMPGFREAHVYPFRPNFPQARKLAHGHTRGRKAVLYVGSIPAIVAGAQIIQQDLARIGITVLIREFPQDQLFERLANPHEPYDMVSYGWRPAYVDPYDMLDPLLDGRQLESPDSANFARFDSPKWNRRLAQAAQLRGRARYRAYGKLDVELARDAAPLAATTNIGNPYVVSKRTGCVRNLPDAALDLAAVCLR